MTSTNDGKEVKSNQTSGQKGKSYYIELYKSLDAQLSAECELRQRTQQLCEAWRHVHCLCSHSAPTTQTHLIGWLQRHTASTVLLTEWQSPQRQDERTSLEEAISTFIQEAQKTIAGRDGWSSPWETELLQRAEWFKGLLSDPWGHPVLKRLLNPSGEEQPSVKELLEWLKGERDIVFVRRLRQLAASKCDDLALSLASAVMDRVRLELDLSDDGNKPEGVKVEPKPESNEPRLEEFLSTHAGFTDEVWELLTDIEFVLLHKSERRLRCIELAKKLPLRNSYPIVERLQNRLKASPKEKKLWKNANDVATLITKVVIARCMVIPQCTGLTRNVLYWCTRSLARQLPAARLPPATNALAAPAVTARHLHTLATGIEAQCTADMKPFVCELFVRAITSGMNELESFKMKTEQATEARETEKILATWFMQLGAILSASKRVECECVLTAFSVHPSAAMYDKIKKAPNLPPVALDVEPSFETTSEFGSWSTDSHTQTNFVKTSESLNIKQIQHQTNVLSIAILTEGEGLGLGAELCQDIAVLLSGPRVKTLSWDMDRELLLENCKTYMERTHGGTRALTTELKYLNLDPKQFQHLPEEEDDENDLYYGIEKGYEHLVEFEPQPEQIWEDAIWDEDRTDSSCSSSAESDSTTSRRKKKYKQPKYTSVEDEDPLSLEAETKKSEKMKERPHSKERSKEDKKKKGHRRKEAKSEKKREKKERKKKMGISDIEQKSGSLSSYLGLKVTRVAMPDATQKSTEITNKFSSAVTDSDYDSQGKSSLNSEGNDATVLYDGQFSMDEIKSPERSPGIKNADVNIKPNVTVDSAVNKTVILKHTKPESTKIDQSKVPTSVNTGTIVRDIRSDSHSTKSVQEVKEDVKKSITKLIQFRRQKLNSGEELKSPITSPTIQNVSITQPDQKKLEMASLIGAKIVRNSEAPKVFINERQVEQLNVLKNEVNNLLTNARPVIQNANKHHRIQKGSCSRVEPVNSQYYKRTPKPNQQPNTPVYYVPTLSNHVQNSSIQNSCIQNNVQNSPVQNLPQQHHTNSVNKISPQSCITPQPSPKLTDHQQSYQEFLKELQGSINAGLFVQPENKTSVIVKKEMKPVSRVIPVIPNVTKSEPAVTPQCAKPIQQRKGENAPNTFSRLSYMHKNKQAETKAKTDPIQSQMALQNSISAELDQRIADLRHCKGKYLHSNSDVIISRVDKTQTKKQKETSARVDIQKMENNPKPSSFVAENPLLSNILRSNMVENLRPKIENPPVSNIQTDQVKPKPATTASLSDKDQQELILLLRQQSKLNSYMHKRVVPSTENINNKINNLQYLNTTIVSNLSSNKSTALPSTSAPVFNKTTVVDTKACVQFDCNNVKTYVPSNITNTKTPVPSNITNTKTPVPSNITNTKTPVPSNITNTKTPVPSNITNAIKTPVPSNITNAIKTPVPSNITNTIKTTDVIQNVVNNNTQIVSNEESPVKNMFEPVKVLNNLSSNSNIVNVIKTTAKKNSVKNCNVDQGNNIKHQQDWTNVLDAIRAHKTPRRGPNALDFAMKKDSYEKFANEKLLNQRVVRINTDSPGETDKSKTVVKQQTVDTSKPSISIAWVQKKPNAVKTSQTAPKKSSQAVSKTKKPNLVEVPKKLAQEQELSKKTTCLSKDDPFISGIQNSDYDLLEELMDDDLRQEIGELMSDEESYSSPTVAAPKEFKKPNVKSSHVLSKSMNISTAKEKPKVIETILNTSKETCAVNKPIISKSPSEILMKTSTKSAAKSKPFIASNERICSKISKETPQRISNVIHHMPKNTKIQQQPKVETSVYNVNNNNIVTNNQVRIDSTNVLLTASLPVRQNVVVIGSEIVYDPFSTQISTGLCNVNQNAYILNNTQNLTMYQATQYSAPVVSPLIGNALMMTVATEVSTATVPTLTINPIQQNQLFAPNNVQPEFLNHSDVANPNNQVKDFVPLAHEQKPHTLQSSENINLPIQSELKEFNKEKCEKMQQSEDISSIRSELKDIPMEKSEMLQSTDDQNSHIRSELKDIHVDKSETVQPCEDINLKSDSRLPFDFNLNKNCERKVLVEVQEKLKVTVPEDIDQKTRRLSLESDVKKEALKDEERLKNKRMALINREISHHSFFPPIPLSYAPLTIFKPTVHVEKGTNIRNKIVNVESNITKDVCIVKEIEKSTDAESCEVSSAIPNALVDVDNTVHELNNENSKENKDNASTCRRILLRSSNKLKTKSDPMGKKIGRKTKVRLKTSASESSQKIENVSDVQLDKNSEEIDNPINTNIDEKNDKSIDKNLNTDQGLKPSDKSEGQSYVTIEKTNDITSDKLTPTRISKRILNRKIKKQVSQTLTKDCDEKKITEDESDVSVNDIVPKVGFFDIENALLGAKIPKTKPVSVMVVDISSVMPRIEIARKETLLTKAECNSESEIKTNLPQEQILEQTSPIKSISENFQTPTNFEDGMQSTSITLADDSKVEETEIVSRNTPSETHQETEVNENDLIEINELTSHKVRDVVSLQEPNFLEEESLSEFEQYKEIKELVTETTEHSLSAKNSQNVIIDNNVEVSPPELLDKKLIPENQNPSKLSVCPAKKSTSPVDLLIQTETRPTKDVMLSKLVEEIETDLRILTESVLGQLNDKTNETQKCVETSVNVKRTTSEPDCDLDMSVTVEEPLKNNRKSVIERVIIPSTKAKRKDRPETSLKETPISESIFDNHVKLSPVLDMTTITTPCKEQPISENGVQCIKLIPKLDLKTIEPVSNEQPNSESSVQNHLKSKPALDMKTIATLSEEKPVSENIVQNYRPELDMKISASHGKEKSVQNKIELTPELHLKTKPSENHLSKHVEELIKSVKLDSMLSTNKNVSDEVASKAIEDLTDEVIAIDSDSETTDVLAEKVAVSSKEVADLSQKNVGPKTQENSNETIDKLQSRDIPQSYKDSIKIEEIPIPNVDNPFKRCVRIRLPSGKVFKATISGKAKYNFDTIFSDPTLKQILLSGLEENKRYTLNIEKNPNEGYKLINTQINHSNDVRKRDTSKARTVETVNLISDDEEDNVQSFNTEFGNYSIKSLDEAMFIKHQSKFSQKCFVKLKKLSEDPKSLENSCEPKLEVLENKMENSSATVKKSSEVIEIDDSSSDAELTSMKTAATSIIPAKKIDEFKESLLKDFGVDLITGLEQKNASEKVLISEKPTTLVVDSVKTETDRNSKEVQQPTKIVANEKNSDYSDIIKRKYCVKLVRCDNLVKKMNKIAALNKKPDDDLCNLAVADLAIEDNSEEPELKRSGSFSILNDLGLFDDTIEPTSDVRELTSCSPVIDILETIAALGDIPESGTTSPVMEAFEIISSLQNTSKDINLEKIPDLLVNMAKPIPCDSDWFTTKRSLYLNHRINNTNKVRIRNSLGSLVENSNDVSTDCESRITSFCSLDSSNLEDVGVIDVCSLTTIMARYFKDNELVNLLRPACEIEKTSLISSPAHKRKLSGASYETFSKSSKKEITTLAKNNSKVQHNGKSCEKRDIVPSAVNPDASNGTLGCPVKIIEVTEHDDISMMTSSVDSEIIEIIETIVDRVVIQTESFDNTMCLQDVHSNNIVDDLVLKQQVKEIQKQQKNVLKDTTIINTMMKQIEVPTELRENFGCVQDGDKQAVMEHDNTVIEHKVGVVVDANTDCGEIIAIMDDEIVEKQTESEENVTVLQEKTRKESMDTNSVTEYHNENVVEVQTDSMKSNEIMEEYKSVEHQDENIIEKQSKSEETVTILQEYKQSEHIHENSVKEYDREKIVEEQRDSEESNKIIEENSVVEHRNEKVIQIKSDDIFTVLQQEIRHEDMEVSSSSEPNVETVSAAQAEPDKAIETVERQAESEKNFYVLQEHTQNDGMNTMIELHDETVVGAETINELMNENIIIEHQDEKQSEVIDKVLHDETRNENIDDNSVIEGHSEKVVEGQRDSEKSNEIVEKNTVVQHKDDKKVETQVESNCVTVLSDNKCNEGMDEITVIEQTYEKIDTQNDSKCTLVEHHDEKIVESDESITVLLEDTRFEDIKESSSMEQNVKKVEVQTESKERNKNMDESTVVEHKDEKIVKRQTESVQNVTVFTQKEDMDTSLTINHLNENIMEIETESDKIVTDCKEKFQKDIIHRNTAHENIENVSDNIDSEIIADNFKMEEDNTVIENTGDKLQIDIKDENSAIEHQDNENTVLGNKYDKFVEFRTESGESERKVLQKEIQKESKDENSSIGHKYEIQTKTEKIVLFSKENLPEDIDSDFYDATVKNKDEKSVETRTKSQEDPSFLQEDTQTVEHIDNAAIECQNMQETIELNQSKNSTSVSLPEDVIEIKPSKENNCLNDLTTDDLKTRSETKDYVLEDETINGIEEKEEKEKTVKSTEVIIQDNQGLSLETGLDLKENLIRGNMTSEVPIENACETEVPKSPQTEPTTLDSEKVQRNVFYHSNENLNSIDNETINENEMEDFCALNNDGINDTVVNADESICKSDSINEITENQSGSECKTCENFEITHDLANIIARKCFVRLVDCVKHAPKINTCNKNPYKVSSTDPKEALNYENNINIEVPVMSPVTSQSEETEVNKISDNTAKYICETEIVVEEVSEIETQVIDEKIELNEQTESVIEEPKKKFDGGNILLETEIYDDNIEVIEESHDLLVEKYLDTCDDTILEKDVTLIYKDDSGVILKGFECDSCYVFPITKESDTGSSDLLNDSTESMIEVIQETEESDLVEDNIDDSMSNDLYEYDLKLLIPKVTYSKRNLKRKLNLSDAAVSGKRPRRIIKRLRSGSKGKYFDRELSIDCQTAVATKDTSLLHEFNRLVDYYSSLEFSYSLSYIKEHIEVPTLIKNWPINGSPYNVNQDEIDVDDTLFDDVENREKYFDPLKQTLAEEIATEYKEPDLPSCNIDKTNNNLGFGEGSGRVIQNLEGGVSKFSAATLSDVKQAQPFFMSGNHDDCDCDLNVDQSVNSDQLEKIRHYMTYIELRNKVRQFFKNSRLELTRDWVKEHKNKDHRVEKTDITGFPFHLYISNSIEPFPIEAVVQVVQVGQLPVSAAAQNPVTCDPRVTQVSDASPSQCSVDNSPHDDSQQGTKHEYTELTTADLSLPLVQDYAQHNQAINMEPQENTNLNMTDDNIPIETELDKSEIKIELVEETPEDSETTKSDDLDKSNENSELQSMLNNHVNNIDYSFETNNTNTSLESGSHVQILFSSPEKQGLTETFSQQKQNGSSEKTDQIAHAMNAAGITTTSEPMQNNRAHALVNILSQKIRQGAVTSSQNSVNTYPKATSINAMALQQALAQILPPPLNQTNSSENNQQSQNTQVLHIVQGKNASGNQITLVDNSQQSVINAQNATPLLHIVQNKAGTGGPTSNGTPTPQSNAFSGLSLVDAGIQGGNQLLHIVNTGGQKNNNAGQLLKRVNLLTNLANVQGSNEQKMVQFVCKSADGKAIQLNAPHQRSMVLRLQPIETPNVQTTSQKPIENQDISQTPSATNSLPNKDTVAAQQEIKSRSVYEENYAKFIQNSSSKPSVLEKSTSLPKFNQAFGKPVFQEGNQKQSEMNSNNSHLPSSAPPENTECQQTDSSINLEHLGQISSPPLLLRKSPAQTSQSQPNLVQQLKQSIAPMNIQTMHGGVIYTRQIPVNIGGGQTINLITVPSTELIDDSGQKQQSDVKFVNQGDMEPSIIKIVPQSQPAPNAEVSSEDGNNHMSATNENAQNPQPQPVLTQMRIKLPMLSKNPQMVSGARVVRPSFFQIQRNVIGGANQPVYQQLVLTAAPPLGQQTIRLPQTQTRPIKVPSENQSSSESQMSSSTLEQLREFDMVLEQVKERSTVQPNVNSTNTFKLHTTSTDTTDSSSVVSSTPTETTQQVLYSIGSNQPLSVAYVNRKATVTTPTTSTFVRSPDSSGIVDSPTSSSHAQIAHTVTTESTSSDNSQPKPAKISSKSKSRPKSSSNPPSSMKINTVPPKTSTQKPLEDEQTTQRILYILAEYKEQVENSPDKDKPAPRRRSNPPTNPSGSSKRKKSSSSSRRPGTRDLSPVHGEDTCRTMGSEDSSCGTSQGDCTESCLETHSPQDSPRKVVRKLTFEQEPAITQPRPQPQRNVIVADGQTITVARGTAGKPATAVLMPANYILPVSMVKGGQQIAIVTNRGPKLLTVGGEGGATNALLLQRLIGPAGLKPVLARPGVRHVRLPTAALHNLQAFNLTTATTVQPPDSTASPAPAPTPPELIETGAESSPWTDREMDNQKTDRGESPDGSEPWNLPSSADANDYSYEETVRADNLDRTVLDAIPDRYSPDMEAQRIFDKMFDVESKKSYIVDSHDDSPRCGYDIDASDDDKAYHQVVQKKDGQRQHRLTHVSAATLRHKYAILEHELRLQKSLSEECEDLGVDSPSASELFPEAELLFAASPSHDHNQDPPPHSETPQPLLNQTVIQPDIDDQIATDQLLPQNLPSRQEIDVNLGLEDVGIVTVSEDGMQATIALDQEEFARAHPNTTFHSEPTDETEVQPFTLSGLKARHITSTIFHSNRAPATVLMTAPQTTVISQTTTENNPQDIKYSEIDNMINSIPSHANNINLSSVLVKDDGLTRFDNILTDSRELHLSNTASAIVHSAGNATQVIRRVCYDEDKRERDTRFLIDEPDTLIAGDDAKMIAEDSSRDATLESMPGDVDDDNSSPERHAELFWESNSASERSESRRPLDFSSDSDKCCKSPSFDETNSTDSSGVGTHMRLDSVIKEARGIERSASADGSSADDTHPPLRTYPPKRTYHPLEGEMERSLSGKTRAGERSPDSVRRRASGRGVVKRGCHCCNGSPAPPRSKKPRQRKPTMDFSTN